MTKSVTTVIGIKRYIYSSIMKAKFDIDVFISYCTFSFNKKGRISDMHLERFLKFEKKN